MYNLKKEVFMDENISVSNKLLGKTFFWMVLGLLGSAIISWYTYSSGLFIKIVLNNSFGVILIIELCAVLIFNLLFKKLSPTLVRNFIFYIFNVKWCNFICYFCNI